MATPTEMLIVCQPFSRYRAGDAITDLDAMASILASEQRRFVARVNVPAAPATAPAASTATPAPATTKAA